jgi:arginine/lysine/ornithine decarboxylase
MTGAIPVFLKPTRNHFGIIGPIRKSEFSPRPSRPRSRQPAAQGRGRRPSSRASDAHAVHLRRRALQHRDHQGHAGRLRDNLHFDEAWLPHAAFHPFYGTYHAMGKKRAAQAVGGLFHPVHPQAAGRHQPGQHVLVQDSQNVKLDRTCSTRRT